MSLVVGTPRIAFPGGAGGTRPGTDLVGDSLVLKYTPPNSAGTIETRDVKIYLDVAANKLMFDQKTASGYETVTDFDLPIQ